MPVIVDKGKPVPFLRDRALYAVLRLESKSGVRMGILPVTDQWQRIIRLGNGGRFILAEDVILAFAHTVFGNSRVIDRTILILDIFAGRARTAEGKVQVALAQYKYRLTRLTGMGNALSRL